MARKVGQPIVFLYLHDCLAETCPEHVFAESRHHSVEEDGGLPRIAYDMEITPR
jgi:hypothetical protein